jgi:hypothetical protein
MDVKRLSVFRCWTHVRCRHFRSHDPDDVAGFPPVLLVRVTPKLVEGFWTNVARGAAQTQGVAIPPIKRFTSGFSRMRASRTSFHTGAKPWRLFLAGIDRVKRLIPPLGHRNPVFAVTRACVLSLGGLLQVAHQQRHQFGRDRPIRQIVGALDDGAMNDGIRGSRDDPHRSFRIPDPSRRTRQQRSKLTKQWFVGRRDVGITELRQFLAEDAVQFRIHGVCRHPHRYQRSQCRLETVAAALDQDLSDRRAPLCAMPTPQFRDDGQLARKVLIEGCDVDASAVGDPICRQTTGTLANENVSRGLQNCLNSRARALLPRRFPRRKPRSTCRLRSDHECKLTKASNCLHHSL